MDYYKELDINGDLKTHLQAYKKIYKPYIVLHDTGVSLKQPIHVINEYHISLGYTCIGYDIYIEEAKTYETARLYQDMEGAHARGWNRESIGICLAGHEDNNTYQIDALRKILDTIITINPKVIILFHRDLSVIRNDPSDAIITLVMDEYAKNAIRYTF